MNTVTIHDAKTNLSRLIARAEKGEEIIISRGTQPVVKLVAVDPPKKRIPGMFKGQVDVGPAFFEPLSDEELALYE
jgi:prevent-host-death family protein